jgi:membrane fusion protein, macrolide-specific efflux system
MRSVSKRNLLIVAAIVVAPALYLAFPRQQQTPQLATASAQRGDVEDVVLATGALQPVQLVSVGAQVSGRVVALSVNLGDHVTKGQVIATIDPVPATNQLKTAQAALAQAIAQRAAQAASLAQSEATLKRQVSTVALKLSSQADYDAALAAERAAKANLDALDASIDQAKVNVDVARVNLGYTNVVAPIEGDVLAVVTKQGQTVNAVQAAPTIVILGDMSTMTAKAQISEADVVKVKPGQEVYFTILGDTKRRFSGRLRSVALAPNSIVNEVVNNTATTSSSSGSSATAIYYDGLVDVPNDDRMLKADMTAQITMVVAQANGVVTIPAAALDPTGTENTSGKAADEHVVLVLDTAGRPQPRRVRIGINNRVTAEVTSGLAPGEEVVTGQAPSGAQQGALPPPPRMF